MWIIPERTTKLNEACSEKPCNIYEEKSNVKKIYVQNYAAITNPYVKQKRHKQTKIAKNKQRANSVF